MRSGDWWLRLAQPRYWLLFLLGYLLIHMGMRLLLSDTLQLDDAEQLIHSQEWRLDYGNFQPPFYTWLLWALWHIVDPSMWALYLLRYLIIGLAFWLWYRVSCLLFKDPRWIVASATSWLLLGEFAWKLHQGSTHTTLLTLALIMSLHAIVLLLRRPCLRHYLYLGFAVGLGMMAKYSYAGFLIPMLVAGLAAPDTRDRLLRWPILSTLGIALLMMSPVLWTLLGPDVPVGDQLQAETRHRAGGLLQGDPSLLLAFARGALNFLAPMFLIYLAVFRVSFRRVRFGFPGGNTDSNNREADFSSDATPQTTCEEALQIDGTAVRSLLNRFHLAGLGILLVVALFAGIDHFKVRWLHPFLALVPFWWLLHAAVAAPRRRAWEVLKWVTLGLVVLVLVARLWQLLATPYIGKKPSRVTWPVMAALAQVPREALDATELYVGDAFLGGHVRLLTDARVRVAQPPPDAGLSGVWLWGSASREQPDAISALPAELAGRVHWFSAQRGGAVYRVACNGSSPAFEGRCQP